MVATRRQIRQRICKVWGKLFSSYAVRVTWVVIIFECKYLIGIFFLLVNNFCHIFHKMDLIGSASQYLSFKILTHKNSFGHICHKIDLHHTIWVSKSWLKYKQFWSHLSQNRSASYSILPSLTLTVRQQQQQNKTKIAILSFIFSFYLSPL